MPRLRYHVQCAALLASAAVCGILSGCANRPEAVYSTSMPVYDAIERFRVQQLPALAANDVRASSPRSNLGFPIWMNRPQSRVEYAATGLPYVTLGIMPQDTAASQPADEPQKLAAVPEGYWRKDVWHQMGHEARDFGTRDLWRGFQTSFWDVENALVLTAALGVSITLRETGVDDTIRRRTDGHRQLGDFDEPIQILGNPGTHFAGAGVLWLTSTLIEDEREHEVAKSLIQALAVNGLTTVALKGATHTTAPNGSDFAWPSGHTSSAFTVAAVVNEHYGPWVGVPAFALAGLVGYERIDSREHDFSDVVFGAVLGTIIGTSIASDEEARFPEIFGMQVVPFTDPQTGATGLALMKSW